VPGGFIGHATYGGKVNTVAPDATASFQRDAIMVTSCTAGWQDPKLEEEHVKWARNCYKELFADTGGVPAASEQSIGALINHPDADLADEKLNTSGIPWHSLYYGSNYARLQQVKARWDPCNIFHHALSVQPTPK
jgi:aclacinomycin oxidase